MLVAVIQNEFINETLSIWRPSRANPNFSDAIVISIFESQFQFVNPVLVLKSLFKYLNQNFSFQILISVMKSQFQYLNRNFSFQIPILVMKLQFHI